MSDFADNIKHKLYSSEMGWLDLNGEGVIDYDISNKDIIERNDDSKEFEYSKDGAIQLYGKAFDYIVSLHAVYGIIPDLRLYEYQKDELTVAQKWKQISNIGLDLGTAEFDYETKTVSIESKTGGLMETIDSRMDDEYDVISTETADGETISELEFVNLRLDPRRIFRRSKLSVEDGTKIVSAVSGGDTLNARVIPLQVEYNSDSNNITSVQGTKLNAFDGRYATVTSGNSGNLFYLVADRDTTIKINGTVNLEIVRASSGSFSLDLVRYTSEDLNYSEVIEELDTTNPGGLGNTCSYTFVDYEVDLLEGDSLAIATLSDTSSSGVDYEIFDTEITVDESELVPVTYTDAIRAEDLINRLVGLMTSDEEAFASELFGEGGKYENVLFAHGSWIRRIPRILNEGEEDETIVQASTSLSDVLGALNIIEPLMYGTKDISNKENFYVESEKDSQRNFIGLRLGETTDSFNLTPVDSEVRSVLAENYYSSIILGSETSGSDYDEVSNLYSICGQANWNTINITGEEYEVTTDFRTDAEAVELQRQMLYADYPDEDGSFDDDWFMLDCKYNGYEYELKKWDDFYDEQPTNTYDPDSNYNWAFAPRELIKGHAWKIKSGLQNYPNKYIVFASSNCSSSLITDGIQHDSKIKHSILDSATYSNMMITFNLKVNQEIVDALNGTTNGIDNKFGLVEFLSEGEAQYGRLIKVDQNDEGSFELIEAVL